MEAGCNEGTNTNHNSLFKCTCELRVQVTRTKCPVFVVHGGNIFVCQNKLGPPVVIFSKTVPTSVEKWLRNQTFDMKGFGD